MNYYFEVYVKSGVYVSYAVNYDCDTFLKIPIDQDNRTFFDPRDMKLNIPYTIIGFKPSKYCSIVEAQIAIERDLDYRVQIRKF